MGLRLVVMQKEVLTAAAAPSQVAEGRWEVDDLYIPSPAAAAGRNSSSSLPAAATRSRAPGYLPPTSADVAGGSGVMGYLDMLDGRPSAVSFSAQCMPCMGHGAGPFSTTASVEKRVAASNGLVYYIDQAR